MKRKAKKFFLIKKKKVKIYLGISLELLRSVWVGSVSDGSSFQLILLGICRPLPV